MMHVSHVWLCMPHMWHASYESSYEVALHSSYEVALYGSYLLLECGRAIVMTMHDVYDLMSLWCMTCMMMHDVYDLISIWCMTCMTLCPYDAWCVSLDIHMTIDLELRMQKRFAVRYHEVCSEISRGLQWDISDVYHLISKCVARAHSVTFAQIHNFSPCVCVCVCMSVPMQCELK